jgi:hypothetical protein
MKFNIFASGAFFNPSPYPLPTKSWEGGFLFFVVWGCLRNHSGSPNHIPEAKCSARKPHYWSIRLPFLLIQVIVVLVFRVDKIMVPWNISVMQKIQDIYGRI